MLTHSQGHNSQFVSDETHHLALLQRSGAAADDGPAATAEVQQVALQLLLQGPVQRAAIHNQDECRGGIPLRLYRASSGVTGSSLLHSQLQLLQ